jgi:protein-disulfide isomerase
MPIDVRHPTRRTVLGSALALASLGPASAQAGRASAANQWFPITGDDGAPTPNLRAPVEITAEVDDLAGAIWGGAKSDAVKLVEFYDYNCPFCRVVARELSPLMRRHPDLRVGLVNNPILSPQSAQAAKVELALLKLKGANAAYALHQALFGMSGRIDGPKALDAAASLGAERAELERVADGMEVRDMIGGQLRLSASLGLVATPSFLIGPAAILGYPGPTTMDRLVQATRQCGSPVC